MNSQLGLDLHFWEAYNLSHSEVVREKRLIEKDVLGGSIPRKSSPKSSELDAEEIHIKPG
jgi:hypothetical protein